MADTYPFQQQKKDINIPVGEPIDLVVHAVKDTALRCRVLKTGEPITLKQVEFEVEGEIITVIPSKVWQFKRTVYMAGEVADVRFDITALNLKPLKLEELETWDPKARDIFLDKDSRYEKYYNPITAAGKRRKYEMEQIIPFEDSGNISSSPIYQAEDAYDDGDYEKAGKIIAELLTVDLRCISAHVHLGDWAFGSEYEEGVKRASQHYQTGKEIAELSLGDNFQGVLQWDDINNQPYLRCLQGYGLCLWRFGKAREAFEVFERMLWLNPSDSRGVRELLADIDAGKTWEDANDDYPVPEE